MAWMTTEEKIEHLKGWRPRFPESDVLEYECPRCGWHASSHGESSYGLDCPGGVSPAWAQGRIGPMAIPTP